MRSRLAFCWLLMIWIAEPGIADNKIVSPGTRVRLVTAAPNRTVLTGVFASVRADSLLLVESRAASERAIPISQIASFEVARGTHSQAGRGAKYGLLIGALVGAVWGLVGSNDSYLTGNDPAATAAVGALLVGGLGAGIGAVVGVVAQTDRYERVPPDSLRNPSVSAPR